jgi:GTPase SAR1 family protein
MKPTVMFLVGMPSVGKSTFIENMRWHRDPHTYIHSTDNLITKMAGEMGLTYDEWFDLNNSQPREKSMFATDILPQLADGLRVAVENGDHIVVDMVNGSKFTRGHTLNSLPLDRYVVRATVFGHIPWVEQDQEFFDSIVNAVGERSKLTNKSIPLPALKRMFEMYEPVDPDEGFEQINFVEPLNPMIGMSPR